MPQEIENEENDFSSDESYDEMDSVLQLSLNTLPVEIFLHICSFLDSSTLVHRLGLVCKQFYNILRDDSLWKERINKLWPNSRYPILPSAEGDKLFWRLSCVAAERQTSLWNDFHAVEISFLKDAHEACVDGLFLMDDGRICVSGGRDRVLALWHLLETDDENKFQMHLGYGHDGWIWDITSLQNKIYSCSWDKQILEWDYNSSEIQLVKKFPLNVSTALLCISSCSERNLIASGSARNSISILDPRDHGNIVEQYQPHRGSILNIKMDSRYIISTSNDRTVSVWDLRRNETIKSHTLSKDSYGKCIFMQKDTIYIGDTDGYIHILDINNDFEPAKCFKTEHIQGITGIHVGAGCLITSSLDSTIKISSPTDPPNTIATLSCRYGKIVKMSYLNEVLAVCGDNSIQIWRPHVCNVC